MVEMYNKMPVLAIVRISWKTIFPVVLTCEAGKAGKETN